MIIYRPGLRTLYEFPDVDPELAFVKNTQAVQILPTPTPKPLIDPVADAIAAADARDPVLVEHFVKPFEAAATAPFPADVRAAAQDALLQ
jgi:hypothetical protein